MPAASQLQDQQIAGAGAPRRRLRVLVVDDSVVIRRMVTRILESELSLEVVGFAADGVAALTQAALLQPDVITLDIEMPHMDGLRTVRELRARGVKAVIIMCSSLTTHGATATIEALVLGANDYVTKTASVDGESLAELIPKIKQFFPRPVAPGPVGVRTPANFPALNRPATSPSGNPVAPVRSHRALRKIVAIGVSTGGPTALMHLLPKLLADFPLPIVIVQHMPPVFTAQLAARLCAESRLEVVEASEGLTIQPGRIILAAGDLHMRLKRRAAEVVVALDRGERENSCRPAVDVLFRSVGEVYGGNVIGVMLTGMGQDGLLGTADLRQRGAYIMAQDRASSVVWGMPGAVAEAGLADAVLGLDEIAPALMKEALCS